MFCEIKVVEFDLDLDIIKTKIVSWSEKLFLWFRSHRQVRLGLVNTTSNQTSCARKRMLEITSGDFYYILFFVFFF